MVNDSEIKNTISKIEVCCRIFMTEVSAFNPDASTDRIVENIIDLSDKLKTLYDTNKPQEV